MLPYAVTLWLHPRPARLCLITSLFRYFVIPRRRTLSPSESALTKNAPVTHLESADPKTRHLKSFRIRTYKIRRGEGSAVGFLTVRDGDDSNGVIACQIEEDAVVAATQTEAGKRRLQFLYVARAGGEVAIEAVEGLDGGFSVDAAEIGAGFGRPTDRDALGRRRH